MQCLLREGAVNENRRDGVVVAAVLATEPNAEATGRKNKTFKRTAMHKAITMDPSNVFNDTANDTIDNGVVFQKNELLPPPIFESRDIRIFQSLVGTNEANPAFIHFEFEAHRCHSASLLWKLW
jgi:hypothetical protein